MIELRGVEFVNKGAELMLCAITQKIKENIPGADFVMEASERASADKLRQHNIYVKKHGRKVRFIPRFIRRKLGYVVDEEIDVVLDASGFAFGDKWGAKYAETRLGSKMRNWRKNGKKIILLPQAFGPFDDPQLKGIMEKIVANADLIFAREKQSYQYLKKISQQENILQAPDFTNLLEGKVPESFPTTNRDVAIIPNCKMIETKGNAASYINFLQYAISVIQRKGLKPYFLIHEGNRDIEIAKQVNSLFEIPIDIITAEDALSIKGVISTAFFIVCSRFHGVVSALSQGVPCITTSWSHKYEMLHQEYNYEEGLLKDICDLNSIEQKITLLSDRGANKTISEKLLLISREQKERSNEMWKAVFKVLNS